eukprot:83741_1
MSQKTVEKRKRTVNNALVDIDSVSVSPGVNYINWIKVARQQLKQRESIILKIKINKIQSIVNNESRVQHFAIQQEIIDTTMKMLCNKIDQWKGV